LSIPNDNEHYDTWIRFGYACFCAAGSEAGRDIWEAWSRKSTKFNATEQETAWNRLQHAIRGTSAPRTIGAGTIFFHAHAAGWTRPAPEPPPEPPPRPDDDDDDGGDAEAEITRLAALPLLEYGRVRKPAAKQLGIPVGILDKLVSAERGGDGDDGLQGKPVEFPEPQPWPSPVNGAALLRTLARYFSLHTRLPPCAHHVAALWCLHCFCFDLFALTPRLQITVATKEAGKSTLLDLLNGVVPKPLETEGATEAALFRVIARHRPTLLIDEGDTGGGVLRCEGDDLEVRNFPVHAPIAIAGIGRLHGTIESRSIRITMQRRRRSEAIRPIDDATRTIGERLCRKAAQWVADHANALRKARPDMGELINRRADLWRPLYAIADAAGGEWPDLAHKAQAAIRAASNDDADSLGEQLLADLRDVFGEWAEQHRSAARAADATEMESAEIVRRLLAKDGRPWAELPGRRPGPLTTARLARLLKPFGIAPGDIGPEGRRRKGYHLLAFADAFERHLP